MNYERLLSFGDVIQLNINCNASQLMKDIGQFKWKQYNPSKDIKRYGLSITSLDGEINGIDLDSIYEYNNIHGTNYTEESFTTLTSVYYMSEEIQRVVDPFLNNLCRSHLIHLAPGGYFPPHRDLSRYLVDQRTFRIVVPLKNCNPPDMYFMYEDKPLYFDHGSAYFINTNKVHNVFSMNDSYFIVFNITFNEESVKTIFNHLAIS